MTVLKGELLDNGVGFRCADCGISVWADPNRTDDPQIVQRRCTACYTKARRQRP